MHIPQCCEKYPVCKKKYKCCVPPFDCALPADNDIKSSAAGQVTG